MMQVRSNKMHSIPSVCPPILQYAIIHKYTNSPIHHIFASLLLYITLVLNLKTWRILFCSRALSSPEILSVRRCIIHPESAHLDDDWRLFAALTRLYTSETASSLDISVHLSWLARSITILLISIVEGDAIGSRNVARLS